MADSANITSIDALQRLRNAIAIYIEKAGLTVDEAGGDVRRLRMWLQGEQTEHWKREYKRRLKKLEDARAELLTARMSDLSEVSMLHQMAVKRAERELEEAETKLRHIKRWLKEYDHRVLPLIKQLDKFRTVLAADLPKGMAFLDRALDALDDYSRLKAPSLSDVTATESVDLDAVGDGANDSDTPENSPT